MNSKFLVSFIVPVYKVRGYIGECADSFLEVSDALLDQFEVIFVDDCSPDESIDVLNERLKSAKLNVKVVSLKENVGLGLARNEGLKEASGKYIAFVDSDDFLDVSEYLRSVETADEAGADLVVLNYYRFWNDGAVRVNVKTPLLQELSRLSPFNDLESKKRLFENFNVAWNKVYRRDLISENNLLFSEGYYEDIPWNYCSISKAKKIQVSASPVYYYRQRSGSILNSRSKAHLALVDQQLSGLRNLEKLEVERELIEKYVRLMNSRNSKFIYSELARLAFLDRLTFLANAKRFWSETKSYCAQEAFESPGIKNWPVKTGSSLVYVLLFSLFFMKKWGYQKRVKFGRWAKGFLYRSVFLRLPLIKKRALFESYWGKSIACNPLAVSHEMSKRGYAIVWASKNKPDDLPGHFHWVKRKSWRYWLECARCGFLVNNANFPTEVVKRNGATHVQTKHGTPLKKMGVKELRAQASPRGRSGLEYRSSRWDFVISSNRLSTRVWRESFPYDYKIIESGYPRNDILFSETSQIKERVRQELSIPKDKLVVLYCPTFRDYGFDQRIDWRLRESFFRLCEKDFFFLIRDHYLANLSMFESGACNNVLDVSKYSSVEELIIVSDVLISDYSSIIYDYVSLRRPIIQYVPDLEEYSLTRGLNFDPLLHSPGAVCTNSEEVIETLFSVVSNPDDHKPSKEFLSWLQPFDNGNSAVAVVDAITGGSDKA